MNTDFSSKPRHNNESDCPVEAALNRIGGKWKGLIILRLLIKPRRFNVLLKSLPGCLQRTLTNQLKELEADKIINRTVYAEVPPRVEYSLTEMGSNLLPVIKAMCDWGQFYVQGVQPDFQKILKSAT